MEIHPVPPWEDHHSKPYRSADAPVTPVDDGGNWLLDLQCMLVEIFHWSPVDLAKADVDILLPLAIYYPHWKNRAEPAYADQIDWL